MDTTVAVGGGTGGAGPDAPPPRPAPATGNLGGAGPRPPPPHAPVPGRGAAAAAAPSGGRRLRWHLLNFAAALLLPVLLFAVGVAIEYGGAQRARVEGEARAKSRELEAAVERELSALLAAAQTLATSPALETRDLAAFERQAFEVAAARGATVVLRAPSGRPLVDTAAHRGDPPPERATAAEDPEAERAAAAGTLFVSNLFEGGVARRRLLLVSVPAYFEEEGDAATGRPLGRVALIFPPERLRLLLTDVGLPSGWIASVVDRAGTIVARSHRHEEFSGRPATHNYQEKTRGHSGTFRGTTVEGVASLAAFTRTALGDWRVSVAVPVSVLEAPLRQSLWWLAGVGAVLTGFAVSLALALARSIEKSVAALVDAAARFGSGRGVPLAATPVREVNAVGAALAAAGAELRVRIASERAARREARRELLQAVIDGTSDPILARDLDGRFVLVNRAGADLLGVPSPADALGRHVSDILPADRAEAVLAWDRAVMADGEARAVEDCVGGGAADCRPPRVLVTTKSPWRDADGRIAGVVCVSRDETARRAAEERLEGVRAELLRAARLGAVGAMAAGLAHELNQPLGAAANFVAVAEALLGPAGPGGAGAGGGGSPAAADLDGAREAVAEAARQALRAGEIVRRLRDFVSHGDADMRVEEVGPLVAEACAAALPPSSAPSAEAAIALRVRPDADAGAALVDRVQIQQVVINLVRNAAEALRGAGATEAGAGGRAAWAANGCRREIAVSVRRSAAGGCEVSVADTGPGIAPEVRQRLFEPFASTKPRGMGIGLAICRAIVEAHGGRLRAEPNPGGGALFRFTLPPPLTTTAGGHDEHGVP